MYISRWAFRGIALFCAATLTLVIARQTISSSEMMLEAVVNLGAVVLYVLAWGQLQIAYYLFAVNRLLRTVVGVRRHYKMAIDGNTDAIISYIDGRYHVEIVMTRVGEKVYLIVTPRAVVATRIISVGMPMVVFGKEPSDLNIVRFEKIDERPYAPDHKEELGRLKYALKAQLPTYRRRTP